MTKIYVNRKAVKGPWGGENSFMGALCGWLEQQGYSIVTNRDARIDLALLNALTQIDIEWVRELYSRNVPIIHRKVGFIVSGSKEIRAVDDQGIVEGDRRQIAFSPYIRHSVFQSHYSEETFRRQGFEGPATVIYNGVNETKFNRNYRRFWGLKTSPRDWWRPGLPFNVLIVSWSNDPAKGFADYQAVDRVIPSMQNVSFTFAGRRPEGVQFQNIRSLPPQNHKKLANLYRDHHALLFLGRHETCSNTILEAMNCGLPVIFHPSGSNAETAGPAGIAWSGDIQQDILDLQQKYDQAIKTLDSLPYRISVVGPKYRDLIEQVLAEK